MKKIALAGNPNSGKTTLFNALTGSNQFVGNWPGVTVEKKEGKIKGHNDIVLVDLPGVYSLSPYTLEEVVSRNFLLDEKPDAIINIIDGSNLERNLYLTTQLTELGIPVIAAVNMMDVVRKNGDKLNSQALANALGCEVVEISALKNEGTKELIQKAVKLIESGKKTEPKHSFEGCVEHAIAHIEEACTLPENEQRWYAIKLFERDEKVIEKLNLSKAVIDHIEKDIKSCEEEMDDDSESIITSERYSYISSIIDGCYKRKNKENLTATDKIDRVVTNRWLALPIFAAVMFIVYYISVSTVGTFATDWANDGVFGDGWHLFGIGTSKYEQAVEAWDEKYDDAVQSAIVDGFIEAAAENGVDTSAVEETLADENGPDAAVIGQFTDEAANVITDVDIFDDEGNVESTEADITAEKFNEALALHLEAAEEEPATEDFGVWVPGIPVLIESLLSSLGTADWLNSLILDGIVAGVGAVLGFVPQMLVLFIFLAFLESCGYMARIAFIMDRIFRKFGLSGKSFIPILIGTGCGVPGIMASRTIENERDRRMTIMTTTFIPCGAKLPIIALIAGALFGGAAWVAPSAYFVGIAAIICSGIILKKTRMFAGDPAPFVMELPAYHMPTVGNILRSMWERGWSFIKKAGTIILLATILIWFLQAFGVEGGSFGMVDDMNNSLLASFGNIVAVLFAPLGWGDWRAAAATVTGLIAKENVVGTFGILYGNMDEVAENGYQVWTVLTQHFTALSAYSFLVFNLLCAPCFAAMGAIKREMNNAKWTWFAIGYQCVFAYAVSLCIYQLGMLFTGNGFGIGTAAAIIIVVLFVYLLVRPYKESRTLNNSSLKAFSR